MDVTWDFSTDFLGTRAIALGFEAETAPETGGYFSDAAATMTSPSYTYAPTVPAPAGFEAATIIVHFCASAAVTLVPGNVTLEYAGIPLTIATAAKAQDTETDVIEVVGYAFLGDVADLPGDTLTIAITGVAGAAVVSGAVEALFVDQLEDVAPTLYEAGTVDVYTTPLVLAVDDEHAFVFTGACQAKFGSVTVTLSVEGETFTQEAQVNRTSFAMSIGHGIIIEACDTSFNCVCETDANARTLLDMRVELLRRAGYASQATNPPPGVAELMNSYLQSAQKYLWHRYKPLQTKRFFSWRLLEGIRYYGFGESLACCGRLSRNRIDGAWIEDLNGVWTPLHYGIDPTVYTLQENFGWPSLYEVRQCIEVFPAPDAPGYKLWIKGNFDLLPFSADADTTTIDANPVFDWALGLAKSHKGDKDAGMPTSGRETGYYGMAIRQVKELIASAHVNRRYIPGAVAVPVPTRPVMTHFED